MAKEHEDRIEVTEANFGDLLIEGLEEVLAVRRGKKEPARRVRRVVTTREVAVAAPPRYRAEEVQRIRERMGLSQSVFAQVLNASPETVKAWEQGKREPDGLALALLQVAEEHPKSLLSRLRKVT